MKIKGRNIKVREGDFGVAVYVKDPVYTKGHWEAQVYMGIYEEDVSNNTVAFSLTVGGLPLEVARTAVLPLQEGMEFALENGLALIVQPSLMAQLLMARVAANSNPQPHEPLGPSHLQPSPGQPIVHVRRARGKAFPMEACFDDDWTKAGGGWTKQEAINDLISRFGKNTGEATTYAVVEEMIQGTC